MLTMYVCVLSFYAIYRYVLCVCVCIHVCVCACEQYKRGLERHGLLCAISSDE
jgi:hypothetical protein